MYLKVQVALFGLLVLTGCLAYEDELEDGIVTEEVDDTPIDNTPYESPVASEGSFYFAENFDDVKEFEKKWVKSTAKKEGADEDIAKYDGVWSVEAPQRVLLKGDLGLALKSKAKHAAIASRLVKPFVFSTKPLIVQYEVTMQDGQECGGSYIKLLSSGSETTDLKTFNDRTPYSIMFGPDKCGNDHKLHFIFRHTNPLNGSVEEKHCKKPRERIEEPFKDKQPHMYKLVLKPDNTFTVYLDSQIVNEGSLLSDFTPAVNPPSEIPDPKDTKPEDWDEREKIPDPEASKPDDWDENAPPQIPDGSAVKPDGWLDNEEEMIPDPDAVKPDDWDTDMDGEWEAPLIPNPVCKEAVGCGLWKAPFVTNPRYKGKWRAPYVANPNYKGKWSPKMVPNPGYFQDLEPFKMAPIAAVGIELWSMSQDILFDNILITDDEHEAEEWTRITYLLKKRKIDKEAGTLWERTMRSINYKPGWWALYFVYCAIPVSIYVWYLLGRVREETVIGTLLRATSEHPWLWAIYLVAIALPCTLTLFFCCSSSSKEKDEQARSIAKKTDAASPDDDDTTHAPGGDGGQYESIHKGAGLETKVADSGSGDKEPEEDADEDTKDDEEEEEGQDTEEEEEKELIEIQEMPEAAGDVPRKRKTRKE